MAEAYKATPLETLQDLIRIQSYSGQEGPIQDHIEQLFTTAGIETIRNGNGVYVHLKGKDQTRAMIYNGHVDVVDAGDESKWTHSPWSADVENGRVYGRGASDMKSGDAALIHTALQFAADTALPTDVWFTFVPKEEVDGSGTQEFAEWFQRQGYVGQYKEMVAIFAEPTDMNTAEYGHKGNFFIKASIASEGGHASRPDKVKVHAIEQMAHFANDLRLLRNSWSRTFKDGEFTPPTITTSGIKGDSSSANVLAGHVEATLDLRTIPKFHNEAYDEVDKIAKRRGVQLELLFPDAPTGYTRRDANIIRQLQALVPGLELRVSEGSADLGFLTGLGVEGVMFGPGETEQNHTIDESAPIAHLQQAIDIYTELYYNWAKNN